jgi:hypothetical protein
MNESSINASLLFHPCLLPLNSNMCKFILENKQKESQCEMEFYKQRRKQSPMVIGSFNHVLNHGKEALTCELKLMCLIIACSKEGTDKKFMLA